MREIKFRAWDIQNKEWLDPEDVNISASGYKQVFDRGSEEFMSANAGEIILMQYTGLKDKNGKEIYEGDTLNHYGVIWEVHFEEGCFMIKERLPRDNPDGSTRPLSETLACNEYRHCEVIGNIYSNPELLKEK